MSAVAPRAVRNNNPGNVRLRKAGPWHGQTTVDRNPGGPFAIFDTPVNGFRAAATVLLNYYASGVNTLAKVFNIYAPPSDNNDTSAYARSVASVLGVTVTTVVDMRKQSVLDAMLVGIAKVEAGAGKWWTDAQRIEGIRLALADAGLPSGIPAPAPLPTTPKACAVGLLCLLLPFGALAQPQQAPAPTMQALGQMVAEAQQREAAALVRAYGAEAALAAAKAAAVKPAEPATTEPAKP